MAKYLALSVLALGLALMTMMIVVESEPGLLPLVLVLGGGIASVVAWRRERRAKR